MLKVEHLRVRRGASLVVHDVSLEVKPDQVTCLLGGNGSGKSTILNALCGALPAEGGIIWLNGKDFSGAQTERMLRAGLALVPQGREVFPGLSVQDNLVLGGTVLSGRRRLQDKLEEVLAHFPALQQMLSKPAGRLSGGQQQQVAIARAMMSDPKLLLMDEPSAGLSPLAVEEMIDILRILLRSGLSILLVEQNIGVAKALARDVYVLQNGVISLNGPADQIFRGDAVLSAYLG